MQGPHCDIDSPHIPWRKNSFPSGLIRSGDTFNNYKVSPLEQALSEQDASLLAEKLLGTFPSPKMEVAIEQWNTARQLWALRMAQIHASSGPYALSGVCTIFIFPTKHSS
jgi:hypothetical protein